jgi:glycosyltransferase involved in cell wall biosynthesis
VARVTCAPFPGTSFFLYEQFLGGTQTLTQNQPIRSRIISESAGGEPDLEIVVPVRNEEANVQRLVTEVERAAGTAGIRYSILFVDDGSQDGTAELIRRLASDGAPVRGLRLSRNFGHQAAISTGLRYARGQMVAIMDGDLQDRPDDLVILYQTLTAGDADVVYAVRRSRKENVLKRAAYRVFYRILSRAARVPIPMDSGDFCVMRAEFVARLNALPERLRFVRGLRAWLGGKQVGVAVDRAARHAGRPQYTFAGLVRLASDGLISFSDAPLRAVTVLGLCFSTLAFIGVVVVVAWKLAGQLPSGFGLATISLSVLLLGGVQLIAIGVAGEYIARIFDEVKGRPVAIVDEGIGSADAAGRASDLQGTVGLTTAEHLGDVLPEDAAAPAPAVAGAGIHVTPGNRRA